MLFGLPRIIHETSGRTEIWNQYSESTRYLLNTPSVFWFSDKDYLQNWLPIRYKRHFQFSLKFMGERVPSCCFPEPDVEMKTRVQIIDLGGDSRTHKWERKEKTQERVAYWEKKKKLSTMSDRAQFPGDFPLDLACVLYSSEILHWGTKKLEYLLVHQIPSLFSWRLSKNIKPMTFQDALVWAWAASPGDRISPPSQPQQASQ